MTELIFWLLFQGFPLPILRSCAEELGMHTGLILDSAIAASSSFGPMQVPKVGRLYYLMAGTGTDGAWSALINNPYQWIQVDLGNWTRVTGVATQGKQDKNEWVTSYSLSTSYGGFFDYVRNKSGEKKVRLILANSSLVVILP